jgi:hypothetical protein
LSRLIEKDKFPIGFDQPWFKSIMKKGALRVAYSQKRLTMAHLRELANQPSDEIPPINFSRWGSVHLRLLGGCVSSPRLLATTNHPGH